MACYAVFFNGVPLTLLLLLLLLIPSTDSWIYLFLKG
jgi:hypothetical protein